MIHPTAIIHPEAQLHPSVEIGPYAVIDGHVSMGPGCRGRSARLSDRPYAHRGQQPLLRGVRRGEAPQDVKYKDEPSELRMGDNNLVREGATVHRSAKAGEATIIGSNNFLMVNSHVGHNVVLGGHVILANGALLAGHVQGRGPRLYLGQLPGPSIRPCRHAGHHAGRLGHQQRFAALHRRSRDNGICGLNVVGLRRAGFSADERLALKKLYHKLFRSGETCRTPWPRPAVSSPARRPNSAGFHRLRHARRLPRLGLMAGGGKIDEGNID